MSTIRVDNFGPSAGGTTYSARGIAKAWVNFNGTGTIAARDSENVSSLTDNGAGEYSVNLTSSFANANYSTTSAASRSASNLLGGLQTHSSSGTATTSGFTLSLYAYVASSADFPYIGTASFGDLA
jgi:hypothetical protein